MSTYELTFLLNNEEEIKSLTDLVNSLKGKIVEEKKWGKRQLAYPIKKLSSAYYYTWKVDIDHKKVPELERKMNFNEKLIRHILLIK